MKSPAFIWALLLAMTIAGWLLAEEGTSAAVGSTAVILIAAIKINFVVSRVMELGWRPVPFRILTTLWLGATTAIILGGYWF